MDCRLASVLTDLSAPIGRCWQSVKRLKPPWQSIDSVVNMAVQEDIEVIGLSSLATDHLVVPELMQRLRSAGLGEIGVIVGGIVPDSEHPMLLKAGVSNIFGPGATREEIIACVANLAANTRSVRGTDQESD